MRNAPRLSMSRTNFAKRPQIEQIHFPPKYYSPINLSTLCISQSGYLWNTPPTYEISILTTLNLHDSI